MGDDTPRAVLLGMLGLERGLDAEAMARLADGGRFAPAVLTDAERARLDAAESRRRAALGCRRLSRMARTHLARMFGEERAEEGTALASRAPLDLRVNALKASARRRCGACRSLARTHALVAARPSHQARRRCQKPAIHAEPAYLKGLVEIQDEGSQLAALLARQSPASRCSTSAPAPAARRWRSPPRWRTRARSTPPTTTSAGSRRSTRGSSAPARATCRCGPRAAAPMSGRSLRQPDLVLIDAPCTGIGAWRRNPDAKWRVRPGALEVRNNEQVGARPRGGAGQAWRPHRLYHLLGAGGGKRRSGPRFYRAASGFSVVPPAEDRTHSASAPTCFAARC